MIYSMPAHYQLKALIFDFDGTLLDSFPAHFRAYEVMLAHFGMEMTLQRYREIYSPNWFAMYEALQIPREQWDEADRVWLAEARRHEPALFPGTRPLLETLHQTYALGLVTSGSRPRVLRDLDKTGLAGFFDIIVTGDDVSVPKPDPHGLQIALEGLGIQPLEALYIGDAREDCQMAHAAGVPFVGLTTEFATVTDEENCLKLASLHEIPSLIESQ